jgi:uncharacterized protein (TIGR00369 family)
MSASDQSKYPLDEKRGAFMEMLGIHLVSAENGRSCAEVVIGPRHLRALEMAHGGLTASLMDTALGMAAHSLCPDGHTSVTAQLDVKYTRPALPGQKLRATGEVKHVGKRTAVAVGEIRAEDGTLIATGSATLMYLPLSR